MNETTYERQAIHGGRIGETGRSSRQGQSLAIRIFFLILTLLATSSLTAFALESAHSASNPGSWTIASRYYVSGTGSWDLAVIDSDTNRLFITRSTHTQIIDIKKGVLLGDIPGQKEAHAVLLVPKLNRGFITDGGGDGAIVVFDLKSYAVIGTLAAIPDVDNIAYDAKTDSVLAASGDGNALVSFKPDIDPLHGKLDAPIRLGGLPEGMATDNDGKVFITIEDQSVIAVLDMDQRKEIARWPVAPGGHPVKVAIDHENHRLFVGCRNPQKIVVMNSENGEVEGTVPAGEGLDGIGFSNGQVFATTAGGPLTVASMRTGKFAVDEMIETPNGSRTIAIDQTNRLVVVPAAQFDTVTKGWPKIKPGTFEIIVYQAR